MFEGKRVFVVGCGPSLIGFDFSRLAGEKVIAVNHAYKLCRHDLHVFYDRNFLTEAKPDGYNPYTHGALVLAGNGTNLEAREGRVKLFRRANRVTPEFRHGLYMGYSSTLSAVNAALIWGATEVYLLGCDARFFSAADVKEAARLNGNPDAAKDYLTGAHHITQLTVKHAQENAEKKYTNMINQFTAFAGLPVYNLSPLSALTIKRKKVDDVLKRSGQASYAILDEKKAGKPAKEKINNGNN